MMKLLTATTEDDTSQLRLDYCRCNIMMMTTHLLIHSFIQQHTLTTYSWLATEN